MADGGHRRAASPSCAGPVPFPSSSSDLAGKGRDLVKSTRYTRAAASTCSGSSSGRLPAAAGWGRGRGRVRAQAGRRGAVQAAAEGAGDRRAPATPVADTPPAADPRSTSPRSANPRPAGPPQARTVAARCARGPAPASLTLHHKRVLKDHGGQALDVAVEGLARHKRVAVHIQVDLQVVGACGWAGFRVGVGWGKWWVRERGEEGGVVASACVCVQRRCGASVCLW